MTDQNDDQQQTGGALRKQLEDVMAKLKGLETENATLKAQARQTTVSGVLTAKKYNPKVAKLIPDDVEPTAEGVQKWLDEYGDVFNVQKDDADGGDKSSDGASGGTGGEDSDQAQEYIQTMRQMGNIGGLLPPEKSRELISKINSPDLKPEELVKLINDHGGGIGMG